MRSTLGTLAFVALFAATGYAVDFYPISSVTSSTAADDFYAAAGLIQGAGVGFDANAPYDRISGGAEGLWVTAACGFPCSYVENLGTPVLTFDLGSDVALTEISTWGYSDGNSNGVKDFSLRFATNAEGTGGFGTSISYNPTFSMAVSAIPRQSNAFSEEVTARYVEFTALSNYFVAPGDGSGGELPGGDRVGLGEVAFSVVPEPSSASLLLFGLLPLLRRRRR